MPYKDKENKKRYYQKNKEIILEKIKEYQRKHPGYCKKWYQNNREKKLNYAKEYNKKYRQNINYKKYYREYDKKYYQEHIEEKSEYGKRWRSKNKEYLTEFKRKYCIKNRKKISEYDKKYRQEHRKQRSELQKKYYQENKEYRERRKECRGLRRENENKRDRERRKIDLKYNLNDKIKTAIYLSIRKNKNGKHWETLVGYTLNNLLRRLKKTMPENYTWKDFLDGKLHIDHIIPKSIFNYILPENPDFKRCWALNNLQLLTKKDNLIKSNHLIKPFQPSLKI